MAVKSGSHRRLQVRGLPRPARPEPHPKIPARKRQAYKQRRTRLHQRLWAALRQPGLVVALLFGVQAALYAVTVAHEGHLDRVRRKLEVESEYNVRLRADLASLRSLDRIQKEAAKIGLVSPAVLAYLPPPDRTAPPKPIGPLAIGAAAVY